MPVLRPVVLSGGAGTRLWPISTPSNPKQFAALIEGDALFDRAIRRFADRRDFSAPFVVTNVAHLGLVEAAATRTGVDTGLVIAEPSGRNTAPACVAAALASGREDILVILPSDHLIEDEPGFLARALDAIDLAKDGFLVTFGVSPDRPETGYGYVKPGDPAGKGFRVERFTEKPDLTEAKRLVSEGYLWNSGMFVMAAGVLLDEARSHRPRLVDAVKASMGANADGLIRLSSVFADAEAVSIDVAIMEPTDRAVTVPIDVGWSDIGSYDALQSVLGTDPRGNSTSGDVVLVDVQDSLVHSTSRKVAVAGVEGVVVVETEDAVLVTRLDQSQIVRDVVARVDADIAEGN